MITKYKPFMNIPLGAFIIEEIENRKWSQEELAHIMGVSLKIVNELVVGNQEITEEMACLLGKALGQSSNYWLNLYNNYLFRKLY